MRLRYLKALLRTDDVLGSSFLRLAFFCCFLCFLAWSDCVFAISGVGAVSELSCFFTALLDMKQIRFNSDQNLLVVTVAATRISRFEGSGFCRPHTIILLLAFSFFLMVDILFLIQIILISDVGLVAAGEKWAMLVAGSSGWGNYRHQADVYHAYQLLSSSSDYDADHVIVLAVDDIAYHDHNPLQGQVFNHPDRHSDVYRAIKGNIDYFGIQVNKTTFLQVLEGVAGGKVVASGPSDRVFVFFSDHGAPGLLGMPHGGPVFADELFMAIERKHINGGFAELVFYLESCESGSIFQGFDYPKLNVYAVTASRADEPSWGTYCPGFEPSLIPTLVPEINTCLGDLFSVSWLEDLEQGRNQEGDSETLEDQFLIAKVRTSVDGTFVMGSHVQHYGSLHIEKELVREWEGTTDPEASRSSWREYRHTRNLDQHAADLVPLKDVELSTELRRRREIESKALALEARFEAILRETAPRGLTSALVDDWDLYRSLILEWGKICCSPLPLDSYSLSFAKLFVHLANLNVSSTRLWATWREIEAELM